MSEDATGGFVPAPDPADDAALDEGEAADGAAPPFVTDAELRALLRRARASGDDPLRRLVTGYLTLRRIGADVIAFLEARDGAATVARTPLLRRARRLMHGRR